MMPPRSTYSSALARILGVVPLDAREWLIVISFALAPAVVGQAISW
jgi:hypothetical protein